MQLTEKSAPDTVGENADRSKAPVFVLGCGRSGTTLLYHMILMSGGTPPRQGTQVLAAREDINDLR